MNPEENQEVITDTTSNGEGEVQESEEFDEIVQVRRADYEKLNQTLGSLKREIKDLKKPKEEPKETPKSNQADDSQLLKEKYERLSLRQAGIDHPEDMELARQTAKKWNVDIDDVLADDDFKAKLERQQSSRANVQATANVRGGTGSSQVKNTPEYWIAKGVPPTADQVPDRKVRADIVRKMMANASSNGKKFYND